MRYLRIAQKPAFLLGVNYWSRKGGPRMWSRFDEATVAAELAQMRTLGLNVCRAFAFLPDWVGPNGQLLPEPLDRFERFLELAHKAEMAVIPTLLVGHMSGENYDFPGQDGRSPLTSDELLVWQDQLAVAVGSRAARHREQVPALLLSNEMPLWTGRAAVAEVVRWASRLRDGLGRVAPGIPVGTGDGVMNLKGGQNGFDPLALAKIVDFFGPHTYYADLDPLRQALWPELTIRALSRLGLPVVLEEFGGSSCQASPENLGAFYAETIHGVFAVGGAGAIGWCFSDFSVGTVPAHPSLADELPYRHHAFELGFGVTDAAGNARPAAQALSRAGALFARFDLDRLSFPAPEVAIVVPSYYQTTYPFSWEDRGRMRRGLVQSYALCQKAGLEAELVFESPEPAQAPDGLGDLARYRLILVPSTQKLLAPSWRALRAAARAGAQVYFSYYGGDHDFHQALWIDDFEATTGAAHDLRYGCFDRPDPVAVIHVVEGDERYRLVADTRGGSPYGRAFLPLRPHAAEVVGRDGRGRPALLRHRLGQGAIWTLAYPWEHYLGEQAEINDRDGSHRLYRHLGRRARVSLHPDLGSPLCQQHRIWEQAADGTRWELCWLINRSWGPTSIRLDPVDGEASWIFPEGGAGGSRPRRSRAGERELVLGPKEVRVLRRRAD